MHRFMIAAILVSLSAPAFSQGAPQGQELQLTVRPTGRDLAAEAQERQAKLLQRLEQSDHMIRSICINCGDAWKHQIYEPFNPYAALKPSTKAPGDGGN